MTHEVRADSKEFAKLKSGEQTFVMRLNENFAIQDLLTVREFDDRTGRYSNNILMFKVLSIESGEKHPAVLSPRFVILSLARCGTAEPQQ